MSEDYYNVLGVGRDASSTEIQKAYRELARKYHPDLNPDDKTAKGKFQLVQNAFDVLNDSNKREMYDRYGSAFESMGGGGPQGSTASWSSTSPEGFDFSELFGERASTDTGGGFADIFAQFRGASGNPSSTRQTARRGPDIQHSLTVPFATSITGGEARVSLVRANSKRETIEVKIPTGIEDGKKIRLRGQGDSGTQGGPRGDILITIRVTPHPYFRRHGNDLEVRVPVTLSEAVSGAKIDFPTPSGMITLTIPQGSSSGKKLRVKGLGIQSVKGRAGDLYAEIQVVLPENLDREDRELIYNLSQKHPQNPRGDLQW